MVAGSSSTTSRPEAGEPQRPGGRQAGDAGAHDEDAQGHRSYASEGDRTRVGAKTLPAATGAAKPTIKSASDLFKTRGDPAARSVAAWHLPSMRSASRSPTWRTSLAFYRRLGLDFPAGAEREPHVEAVVPGGIRLMWDTHAAIKSFDPDFTAPAPAAGRAWPSCCADPAEVDQRPRRAGRPAGTAVTWSPGTRPGVSATPTLQDPDGNSRRPLRLDQAAELTRSDRSGTPASACTSRDEMRLVGVAGVGRHLGERAAGAGPAPPPAAAGGSGPASSARSRRRRGTVAAAGAGSARTPSAIASDRLTGPRPAATATIAGSGLLPAPHGGVLSAASRVGGLGDPAHLGGRPQVGQRHLPVGQLVGGHAEHAGPVPAREPQGEGPAARRRLGDLRRSVSGPATKTGRHSRSGRGSRPAGCAGGRARRRHAAPGDHVRQRGRAAPST